MDGGEGMGINGVEVGINGVEEGATFNLRYILHIRCSYM